VTFSAHPSRAGTGSSSIERMAAGFARASLALALSLAALGSAQAKGPAPAPAPAAAHPPEMGALAAPFGPGEAGCPRAAALVDAMQKGA